MSGHLKIVTIGGGSSYTPELIEGFIERYEEFPINELWLVDIPESSDKLRIIEKLSKRMVNKAELPIKIHTTFDRREALENADFVTTQIRVGKLNARIKDEKIPLKHDVIGQETIGPGGLFKAFRTIPVILDICKDMEELCPNAWLINFSNPAGMVTEAVLRFSNIERTVGLCNVPIGMKMGIAKVLDIDPKRIHIDFVGLNHLVYGIDVYLDGVLITDKVINKITKEKSITMENIRGFDWQPEFIEALGVLLCPYHRYYYKKIEMLKDAKEAAGQTGTRAEVVQRTEKELFELYKDPSLVEKPEQLQKRGGAYYSDAACNLMSSIYNNKCDIQTVNTKNRNIIEGLPYDSAIEISSVITKEGPVPLNFKELPIEVKGLIQKVNSFERIAVEAAVTGDYQKALLAMTINPLVPSDKVAKKILDEMLVVHKENLPQFSHIIETINEANA